ncbi:hypothetical protein C8Q80DRAFT_1271793 [Daedaleopsis nitida]|nr:hypothetical protein C8Q80DRAFT_1271793 [Daedaleopsis nitida]
MVQHGQITVYTNPYSQYADRVVLALDEAKAEYTSCTTDLRNKPSWLFAVNPAGQVRAMLFLRLSELNLYGRGIGSRNDLWRPQGVTNRALPESAKLAESVVIVEFIAELFPESKLHPADLVKRARARYFITLVDTKFAKAFHSFFIEGASNDGLLAALETLQERLPETGFAVGEWSIADVAIAPYTVRTMMLLEAGLGEYPAGMDKETLQELQQPRYARIMKYITDVSRWPTVQRLQARLIEANLLKFWETYPQLYRIPARK